ncbi:MAG: Eco57I restriction-modification methylase domain-containing protein [Deltaproteobacteria bacterium]|nr:Eco57I restriction-modification methylase domain-containing protein [Deltaproteobacteria bacterium]
MNKQAAINLIADTFNSSFNENRFRHFIRNLFNEFDENKNASWITGYIKDSFKDHVKKYKRIGKYKDIDGNKLDVVVVHLRKKSALDSARTMQRNFIASYLKTRGEKDAAVVAYFTDNTDDWRFSYIRMEYRQEITESGKIKVKEEFTPRRYSFLVGKNEPNHTAQQQLFPILCDDRNNPSLSELEKAFSVEVVTKQFYQDYKGLFEKLTEELDRILEEDNKIKREFESKAIDTANFAKKLLGQIVFLYFLQKKGWLGVPKDERWGKGNKKFLRTLFKKCIEKNGNFFNDYLEYLFYEALATTEGRTTIDLSYYQKFDCKIPFLNGGLFEPINDYNWQETDIHINNDLFTEIFDTFDLYNFTVREDEPLEKEVAVDPEMLGKVFENLLPGNLRKGQGTYYTPREIVHYMCQESLINYLDTAVNTGEISLTQERLTQEKLFGIPELKQLGLKTTGYKTVIPRKDIENFICKGEFAIEHDTAKEGGTKSYKYQAPETIRKNAQLLDEKLKIIKICDPAIGSGAFPVGMMHEIVKARNVLTTYLEESQSRSIYNFKRLCIQESLYGVDIDHGAIEIAKLRLWLSLVVDEEDCQNIKPLPNLDYKIMQGNSLIEEFYGISLNLEKEKKSEKPVNMQLFNDNKDLDKLIDSLHSKQNALFNATHRGEKEKLKEEVENAIVEIFHHELKRQKSGYFTELKRIEESAGRIPKEETRKEFYESEKVKLDKRYKFDCEAVENELREMTRGNKVRNFFPWKLYFADLFRKNSGFDVVIANPPYVRHEGIKPIKPLLAKEFRKFYCSTADLYTYFYKRGLDLLKSEGCLCFIAPNKFMRAAYGKNTRHLLTNKGIPRFIIDFCDLPIFDATTYPAILLIKKNEPVADEKTLVTTFCRAEQLERIEETIANLGFRIPVAGLKSEGWCLERPQVLALMEKIRGAGKPLGEYVNGHFYYGIKTGLNKAFVIDDATRERLIDEDPAGEELIRPWLRGKDIKKWRINWAGLYVIFTRHGVDIDKYPVIKRHLGQFRKELEPKNSKNQKHGRKPGPYKWYEIQDNIAYYKEFEQSKITWGNLATEPKFAFDTTSSYVSAPANIIPTEDLYLLAILNSPICKWMIALEAATRSGGFLEYKPMYVGKIPIFPASEIQKAPIVECVRTILENPDVPDIPNLEAEINALIFDLYDLTAEEIAIVEESAGRK